MKLEIMKTKMKSIILFKKQFKKDFDEQPQFNFNNKDHFYFTIIDNKKIVNKDALRLFYKYNCEDIFAFFRTNPKLLPTLLDETEHFFIFELVQGEVMTSVTQDDFNYLKQFEGMEFFPFCNSLYSNLVRTKNSIKLIDLKHLDFKNTSIPNYINRHIFVYMNNIEEGVSDLYIENFEYLDDIKLILEKDYSNIIIHKMGK